MVPVTRNRPHSTWNELTSERPEVLEWDGMARYRDETGIDIH
jgi:hypothetical protein